MVMIKKQSKPIASLKKGDKVTVDGHELEIDSHCSGCGTWLPKFSIARNRKWGHYYSRAYGMDSQKWYKGGFFEGKYCSKFCAKRIDEYNNEYDKYPPHHQLKSLSGFFESFNIRYKDLLSHDESLIYNDSDYKT